MAVLISLVFKKLILVTVKVNNSHKINKMVSCLAKTQPQPFLSNGILMILRVNEPTFCAYSTRGPKGPEPLTFRSKQAKGQTHHLNKPDCLKLVNYDRHWFKVKE